MKYFMQVLTVIFFSHLHGEIDLEEMIQDFVIETKRIEIPHHPKAFNPSIIRWKGRLLLSFRDIPDPKFKYTSYFGLVWLDEDFNPVGTPQILTMHDQSSLIPPRSEDVRLLMIGEDLFIVYSDCKEEKISKGGFRVYVAQLDHNGKEFFVNNIECLSKYEGESKQLREKNWTPFNYRDNLLLAYSINPHRILRPLLNGSGECETFTSSNSNIIWDWGILRGGTPGLAINDAEYLTFFHSCKEMTSEHSDGKTVLHYFMGAYTFSLEPPFEIKTFSPEPIVGKGFYKGPIYKPYWHPVRAIFPCGFIFDDNFIWVTYGRQDHETWIIKLDKEGLLYSLVPLGFR